MKRFLRQCSTFLIFALLSACQSNQLDSRLLLWYENGSPKIARTDFEVYLDGQLLFKDTLTYTGIADAWDTHECYLRKGHHRLQFKSVENQISLDTTFMANDTVQNVFVSFNYDFRTEEEKAFMRKNFTPEEIIKEYDSPKRFSILMVKQSEMSVP